MHSSKLNTFAWYVSFVENCETSVGKGMRNRKQHEPPSTRDADVNHPFSLKISSVLPRFEKCRGMIVRRAIRLQHHADRFVFSPLRLVNCGTGKICNNRCAQMLRPPVLRWALEKLPHGLP